MGVWPCDRLGCAPPLTLKGIQPVKEMERWMFLYNSLIKVLK